jgi:hypothetical protein
MGVSVERDTIAAVNAGALVNRERIAALGKFYDVSVQETLGTVVLGELGAETAGLDAYEGIELGIEVGLAAEDLRSNLILLHLDAGLIVCALA